MKLALSTLGLMDRSLDKCIPLAAEIGYQGIELLAREPHLPPTTPPERVRFIARQVHAARLSVPCIAGYVGGFSQSSLDRTQHELEDLRRLLEIAATLNCPVVRVWAGGPEPQQAEAAHWQRAADGLQRAAEMAACFGVRLALELHYGYLHQDASGVCRLLNLVDRAEIGVIYDPANLYVAGAPYGSTAIRQLGRRILHVHVKDSVRVRDRLPDAMGEPPYLYQPRRLGTGAVDYAAILATLHDIGYDGFLSSESRRPGVDGGAVAGQEYTELVALLDAETLHRQLGNTDAPSASNASSL